MFTLLLPSHIVNALVMPPIKSKSQQKNRPVKSHICSCDGLLYSKAHSYEHYRRVFVCRPIEVLTDLITIYLEADEIFDTLEEKVSQNNGAENITA